MGFITNQWLKGSVERNRGHFPVEATIKAQVFKDPWCQSKKVVCGLQAKKSDGNYQTMYFTATELRELLPLLLRNAEQEGLKDIATEALRRLDDTSILEAIKTALARRMVI